MAGNDSSYIHANALESETRRASIEEKHIFQGIFPFEAFDFDSTEKTDTPFLRIAEGWSFILGTENLGTTIIEDGKIRTELLDVTDIFAENVDIGGVLKSSNYVAGTAGFKIDGVNGSIDIVNGTFSGEMNAASGTFTGDVDLTGADFTTTGLLTSGSLSVTGNATIGGNTTVGGTLGVTGALTASTINTGPGVTNVHLMNQNVMTTNSVTFSSIVATGILISNGHRSHYYYFAATDQPRSFWWARLAWMIPNNNDWIHMHGKMTLLPASSDSSNTQMFVPAYAFRTNSTTINVYGATPTSSSIYIMTVTNDATDCTRHHGVSW